MAANENRKSISSLLNPPSYDQNGSDSSLKAPTSAASRRYSAPPRSSFATEQDANPDDQPAKKAKRKRITPEQLVDLLALFEKTDTPSFEVREKLANQLNMTNREVQVWFQNRRAKVNRARLNAMSAETAQSQHRFQHSPLTPGINGSNPKYQFVPTFSRLDDHQQQQQPPQIHTPMDYHSAGSVATRRTSAYPDMESARNRTGHTMDEGHSTGSKHLSIPPPIKVSQQDHTMKDSDHRHSTPLYSPTSDMFNLSLNPSSQQHKSNYFDQRRHSGSMSAPQTPTHQGQYPPTLATPPGINPHPVSSTSSPYHRRSHSNSYSLPPTPAYSDHSAIDLLASAAEYVQKSEEKRKRRASEQMVLPSLTRAELRSVRSKSGSDIWGSVTEEVEEEEKQDERPKPKSFRPWE
ncbi:hypothetical protein INT43_008477 [Umbelopsis isabellina]|uniref:Homeobox domain-containing protein n=1 Tax=Mortierella isabellina TaxID=91625 RepID=A0A8H7PV61_MORIS|nr:hypothetical protein INT43_008477 [Umbelopsis isabellina]